jgi:hypothetical protein
MKGDRRPRIREYDMIKPFACVFIPVVPPINPSLPPLLPSREVCIGIDTATVEVDGMSHVLTPFHDDMNLSQEVVDWSSSHRQVADIPIKCAASLML